MRPLRLPPTDYEDKQKFLQQNTSLNGTSPAKLQLLLKSIMPRSEYEGSEIENFLKYTTRKAVLNTIFKMMDTASISFS